MTQALSGLIADEKANLAQTDAKAAHIPALSASHSPFMAIRIANRL